MQDMSETEPVLAYSSGEMVQLPRKPLLWAFGLLFAMPVIEIGSQLFHMLGARGLNFASVSQSDYYYLSIDVLMRAMWVAVVLLLARAHEVREQSPLLRRRGALAVLVGTLVLSGVLFVIVQVLMSIAISDTRAGPAGGSITNSPEYHAARVLSLLMALPEVVLAIAGWLFMRALVRLMKRRWLRWLTDLFFVTVGLKVFAMYGLTRITEWTFVPGAGVSWSHVVRSAIFTIYVIAAVFTLAYWPIMAVYVMKGGRRHLELAE